MSATRPTVPSHLCLALCLTLPFLVLACSDDASTGGDVDASTGPGPDASENADAAGGCSPTPTTVTVPNPDPAAPTGDHSDVFAGRCGAAVGQIFPPDAPWNQSVRNTCVDPRSDAVVQYLQAIVDGSQTFRIDMGRATEPYGFHPLLADDSVTERPFSPTQDFFPVACDEAEVPVPADGRLEGELGYQCESDGDCHLVVHDTAECLLFEMWRANDPLGAFPGGCLAVWPTDSVDDELRGLSCTSADAAGLPILPLLVTPGEVKRGEIRHALRFILPNNAVQRRVYVRPATHNPLSVNNHGQPAEGPGGTMPPPYGVHLRLRADFDTSGLSPAAAAMAEALKEYGMFHADGGNVTFIASNDNFSDTTWDDPDVALGPNDLRDAGLAWTDFEVVSNLDDVQSMDDVDCTRTPIDEF